MRKITQAAVDAFVRGKRWRMDNTSVDTDEGVVTMRLHGNRIARRDNSTGVVSVTLAGWGTPTTRERVNGVCEWFGGDRFHQQNWEQYYGDQPVQCDEWVTIWEPGH